MPGISKSLIYGDPQDELRENLGRRVCRESRRCRPRRYRAEEEKP